MNNESIERFFHLLAENPEHLAKLKSFGGDTDALAGFARELGFDVSTEEMREYQDKSQKYLKGLLRKKLQQPDVSVSPGAKDFYALMKLAESDDEVSARLAELGSETAEALIAYGKEKGFSFTEQDMQALGKNILEPSDELSDEELELASGGTTLVLLGFLAVGLVAAGGLAAGAVVGGGAAAMVVAFTSAMK
ncbi:MAG: Nif11-like leader peptide family RiPP precursor [Defluviitaleaceae bacterium]|nr:Nif11-like leader peptide family RiPP precursor [Defluviitaleaceae bacterium]